MIPRVEVRQVRPCYSEDPGGKYSMLCRLCEFTYEEIWGGSAEDGDIYQGDKQIPICSRTHDEWPTPCKYHITTEELIELIDSGAANLRALVYIPPDLNDYDGTIRFKDVGKETEVVCMDDEIFYMLDPEYDHSTLDKEISGEI